ncbi:MAG: hypothetical protein AB1733_02530 [Thermodesulfobacteriota bacterium]
MTKVFEQSSDRESSQSTAIDLDDLPESVGCCISFELAASQPSAPMPELSTRIAGAGDRAAALVIVTRKNKITVPIDVNWELQRERNLRANKVRQTSQTTHEEGSSGPLTSCQYVIK